MHLSPLSLLTLLSLTQAHSPQTRQIYQGPPGSSFENLSIRPSGSILLSSITTPNLLLLNPFSPNPHPTLAHTFTSATSTLGITETSPDTFYIVASNLTGLSVVPGTNRLFRVHYPSNFNSSAAPEVSLAATVSEAGFLNGLTTLNTDTVLAADSAKGAVWSINVSNGDSKIVIQDPLMAPPPSGPVPIGINGLRIYGGNTLIFTNSGLGIFAKIAIKPDGTPIGSPATIITNRTATVPGGDDFALDFKGDAFIATLGNTVAEVSRTGKQRVVAGNLNSTEVAEPTSARFGRTRVDRKRGTLYVTTAGGLLVPVNGNETVGGQVIAVEVGGR